jgi:hypothetical protein
MPFKEAVVCKMKTILQRPISIAGILIGALSALIVPLPFVQRLAIFIILGSVGDLLELGYWRSSDKQRLTQKPPSNDFAYCCLRLGLLIVGLNCYVSPWQQKEIIELRILSSIIALFLATISFLVRALPD